MTQSLSDRKFGFIVSLFGGVALAINGQMLFGQGQTHTMAQSGQSAPNGNGTFTTFSTPEINALGQAAFLAGLSGTTGGSNDDFGLFRGNGSGIVAQIVREGQSAPDGNGVFAAFAGPTINFSGQSGFAANLTGTSGGTTDNTGVFRGGGTMAQIARKGQAAPDGNGFFSGFNFGGHSLNDFGQVAFIGNLTGTSGGSNDNAGVYRGQGGAITQIARAGQSVPGGNGQFSTFVSYQLNEAGQVLFRSDLTNTSGGANDNMGIYRSSGSGDGIQIVRRGQLAPDSNGSFSFFNPASLNDLGHAAFYASLSGTSGGNNDNEGIFRGSGGVITQIVREGDIAPDGNGLFSSMPTLAVLNNNGQVAFSSSLSGTSGGTTDDRGIFRGSGSAVTQIAREGQSAPDGNGTFSIFTIPFRLNDSGQVAFVAGLSGTQGGNNDNGGIFTSDGIDMLTVVRRGDAMGGSIVTELSLPSLNQHGQIAYTVTLANGNELVRRFTPDLHWRSGIGIWDQSANWTLGLTPAAPHRVFIDPQSGAAVAGPGSPTHIQSLVVGGPASALFILQQSGTLVVANGVAVTPTGALAGSGTIDGNVSMRGTLRPSDGPIGIGAIAITGDLELVDSVLEIDLAGFGLGEFDTVVIRKDMYIDGTLAVSIDPSFQLGPGM